MRAQKKKGRATRPETKSCPSAYRKVAHYARTVVGQFENSRS